VCLGCTAAKAPVRAVVKANAAKNFAATAAAAVTTYAPSALALVDSRMGTEGASDNSNPIFLGINDGASKCLTSIGDEMLMGKVLWTVQMLAVLISAFAVAQSSFLWRSWLLASGVFTTTTLRMLDSSLMTPVLTCRLVPARHS